MKLSNGVQAACFLALLAAGVTGSSALVKNWKKIEGARSPIESWGPVTVLNEGPVPSGGQVRFQIQRVKVRDDCSLESRPTMYDLAGKAYNVAWVKVKGGPIGNAMVASYMIPEVPPGFYQIHDPLLYVCPEGSYKEYQPIVLFEVGPAA